jgi:sugar phosphate permease
VIEEDSDPEDSESIPAMPFMKALMVEGVLAFSFAFFFIKFCYYGVYYWVPTYLQEKLGYSQVEAGNITSWGSTGGIIGSVSLGLLSDVLRCRSPVHLLGCIGGTISLSFLTTIHDNTHSTGLSLLIVFFNIFENGATIVTAIILCDIGKEQIRKHRQKALARIAGINDGLAGFGSISGQLLTGPMDAWKGWTGAFVMFSLGALCACFPALPFTIGEMRRWLCAPKPTEPL